MKKILNIILILSQCHLCFSSNIDNLISKVLEEVKPRHVTIVTDRGRDSNFANFSNYEQVIFRTC